MRKKIRSIAEEYWSFQTRNEIKAEGVAEYIQRQADIEDKKERLIKLKQTPKRFCPDINDRCKGEICVCYFEEYYGSQRPWSREPYCLKFNQQIYTGKGEN